MTTVVQIPEGLWSDGEPGVIATWLYDDGDQVDVEVTIAEIMIEKTQIEIPAPASGQLRILRAAEQEVFCGDIIGEIG